MKTILTTISIILFNLSSYGQYLDLDWNTQDDICINQVIYFYDSTRQIREIGCWNEDLTLRNGKWILFSKNGQKIGVANFDVEGKKHGSWKIWDETGELLFSMVYKHGERVGTWVKYNKDGTKNKKIYN